jgi:hypothetical protein
MSNQLSEHDLEILFQEHLPSVAMSPELAARLGKRVLAEVALSIETAEYHIAVTPPPETRPQFVREDVITRDARWGANEDAGKSGRPAWLKRWTAWSGRFERASSLALVGASLAILLLFVALLPRLLSPEQTSGSAPTAAQPEVLPPAQSASDVAGVATIRISDGAATLYHHTGTTEALTANSVTDMAPGDLLQVIAGQAEIAYFPGQSSQLETGAQVRLVELSRTGGATQVITLVESGRTRHRVERPLSVDDHFEVRTPAARALVQGADFAIETRSINETYVTAFSGVVTVETASERVQVAAGEQVVARTGRALIVEAQPIPTQQIAQMADGLPKADLAVPAATEQLLASTVDAVAVAMMKSNPTVTVPRMTATPTARATRNAPPGASVRVTSGVAAPTQTPTRLLSSAPAFATTATPTSITTATNRLSTATPSHSPSSATSTVTLAPASAQMTPAGSAPTFTPTRTPTATKTPIHTPTQDAAQPTVAVPTQTPTNTATPAPAVAGNQAPQAVDDRAMVDEDGTVTIRVLENDRDAEGDVLIITGVTQPRRGRAVNNGNGTIAYRPDADYAGPDRFTYRISDGRSSATAAVTINVTPIDDVPVLSDVADQSTDEDQPLTVRFTANDVETSPDELTYAATVADPSLIAGDGLILGGEGVNRTLTIRPRPDQAGSTTVTLTVDDGERQSRRTFEINVAPVDDAPVISEIAAQVIDEDAPAAFDFTVADVDDEVSTLDVRAVSSDPALIASERLRIAGLDASRTLTLLPEPDQSGNVIIAVSVNDGQRTTTQSFTVTVKPVNDPPVLAAVADQAMTEDASIALEFNVDDVDNDVSGLALSAVADEPSLIGADGLIIEGAAGTTRTLRITPNADHFGVTTVTVTASDGQTQTQRSFQVTVTPVNDPPAIAPIPDRNDAREDESVEIFITLSDPDDDSAALIVGATSSNQDVVSDAGIQIDGAGGDRILRITPNAGRSGSTVITVSVGDGRLQSQTSFALTVMPVDDPPSMGEIGDQRMLEDQSLAVELALADPDTDLAALRVDVRADNPALVGASGLTVEGTGATRTLRITPTTEESGATTITVGISDGTTRTERSFLLTVEAVNDPPSIGSIGDQIIQEDAPISVDVSLTDPDNDPGTLGISSRSSDSSVVADGDIVIEGAGANRVLRITPATDQSGTTVITVSVDDGQLQAKTSFTLTVTPVNDPPTANPDAYQGGNGPFALSVLENDVDDGFSALRIVAVGTPVNGEATTDGVKIFYSPSPDFSGTEVITYTLSDGQYESTGEISIVVE